MDEPLEQSRARYEEGRRLFESGDFAGAIEKFQASILHSPHFKSLELLGEAYLRLGRPSHAIVPLAAATTLNSQVRAPSLLAEALLAVGERLRAHEVAKLALDRDATNKKARSVFEATQAEYSAWSAQ